MARRFILSIDGGGIRGIIPAAILVDLAGRLKGLPLHQAFDMIVGTSTGGIIAAGLTCPHPDDKKKAACTPADLLKLYTDDGPKIFEKPKGAAILNPFGINDPRYKPDVLENRLQEKLGKATLDQGLSKVVITAYDIESRAALFMSNADPENSKFRFWEAARATSAAPTYFPPALIERIGETDRQKRHVALIDGGVFANDPILAAYVEARKQPWKDDELVFLSLGTGQQNRAVPYQEAKEWGIVGWMQVSHHTPLISILMQGQASTASYQANKLLNPPGTKLRFSTVVTNQNAATLNYFRLDQQLTNEQSDALDDTEDKNIEQLQKIAAQIIKDNAPALGEIAKRILANQ